MQGAPAEARKLGFRSDGAFEIVLLGDALMRFIRSLDAILPLLALGRKQLCDLIHAARSGLASGARRVIDGLANLEPVIARSVPRVAPRTPQSASATELDSPRFPMLNVTTESSRRALFQNCCGSPLESLTYNLTSASHSYAA